MQGCLKVKLLSVPQQASHRAPYNVIYHIGRDHDEYSIAEAKASLKEFDECVATFERLLDDSLKNNRVLSQARYDEFIERIKYLRKLRYSQGVYMKRMMSDRAFIESK